MERVEIPCLVADQSLMRLRGQIPPSPLANIVVTSVQISSSVATSLTILSDTDQWCYALTLIGYASYSNFRIDGIFA